MSGEKNRLDVHVVVTVTGESLSAIVDHTRGNPVQVIKDGRPVDAADMVGLMITRFLDKYDFERFVQEDSNYPY
ncbi:MAG: hypothetical protein AB1724_13745 [Thermodesulfobacteriota bacterium]